MDRTLKDIIWIIIIIAAMGIGISVFDDRKYLFVSLFIALSSCGMFYSVYERRRGGIRRMVLIAVLVAMAVAGRCIFAPVPGFTPVAAIAIISAVYLGAEPGFIVGSLTALVSDIFFGIGPWTPFQMCAWGIVGLGAGIPFIRKRFSGKIPVLIYGALSGAVYSVIMDIWTVLSIDGNFYFSRYIGAFITSVPFIFIYAISNVIFLAVLYRPIGKKLLRMNKKHCIF